MAPVAGFVPEIVTNVLRSPFFRRGNKTPRKGAVADNASPSLSEPQAGPSEPAVLQSSPRVATLENQTTSVGAESVKEPPTIHPASFASFDSLGSENSVKSELNKTRTKLEPIIEQPTPSVTPNVSPPQKTDSTFPAPSRQNSSNIFPSPTTIEKPQAHIARDSPSSRTVTFLTAARASNMKTGISFQSFGSPYPPSVEKMDPDGSADMSVSSEDEPFVVFATPPATPTMDSELPTRESPPAVVLLSPSSERGLVLSTSMSDAFAKPPSPSRLSAPLRTASESTSDSNPSVLSRTSTGYSSDTGNTSLPITPLETPPAGDQTKPVVWVGEHAIEPIGVPLPTTYAEARSLANVYPEIAEELLKRPLGPSHPPSRVPSPDSRPVPTPSPAPTSDADDADDERSQIRSPPRRREHSPDHPNWALAPEELRESRERSRQRGRGRDRQLPQEFSTRGKQRNRRARGRKSGAATSLERLNADASVSEIEISPAQVMVETLLRAMKGTASQYGRAASLPLAFDSEASVLDGEDGGRLDEKGYDERVEAVSHLMEARKAKEAIGMSGSTQLHATPKAGEVSRASEQDDRMSARQAASKATGLGAEGAQKERQDAGRARSATETQESVTPRKLDEQAEQVPVPEAQETQQRATVDIPVNRPDAPLPTSAPNASGFFASSQPFVPSAAHQSVANPNVNLPPPRKTTFSPFAPEFVPGRSRTFSNAPNVGYPDVHSSPTHRSGFNAGASPFAFTANPAAAAIVNIANHAHSSAAALAKRASEADLAGAANWNMPAVGSSVANTTSAAPPLFSPPVANVTAAVPPSMVPQPAVYGPATTQSLFTSPVAALRPVAPLFAHHVAQSPVPERAHSRRGSTASLSSAFGPLSSQSSAPFHPGLSKHASMASLHGISPHRVVPSPLSRRSPIIAQTVQSPEVTPASFVPTPPIHAPTPVFGGVSKRPSVANLAAVVAAPPFVPPATQTSSPTVLPTTGPSHAASGQTSYEPPASPTLSAPSYASAVPREVIYATPQRPVPVSRESSPAYAWTPATRPVAKANANRGGHGPGVIGDSRNHTVGGALPGYDVPELPQAVSQESTSPVGGASKCIQASVGSSADVLPSAQIVTTQVLDGERVKRERTVTSESLDTPLVAASPAAKQAIDSSASALPQVDASSPAGPAVRFALLEPDTVYPALTSPSVVLKNHTQEIQSVQGSPLRKAIGYASDDIDALVGTADLPTIPCAEMDIQDPTGTPIRPPTSGGQVSLTKLVAQLHLGEKNTPPRPTSVVPSIHAGTPEQPAHWTIDVEGKLRVKKGDGQSESESPSSQPQVLRPTGPPLPRRRVGREQPEAYKPYFQNAGSANPAQAGERFAVLRRRSMYFAREEGGVRDEGADRERDRDGSPGEARAGPRLWRRGSGMWRKRVVDEDEEQPPEGAAVDGLRGRERERTQEAWRSRRSLSLEEDMKV